MPRRRFYVEDNTVCVKPPFTGRERKPLEWSIRKWKFIVKWLKEHRGQTVEDGGGNTCALCWVYTGCDGCDGGALPEGGCGGFYGSWWLAAAINDHKAALSAAREMLAFLERL